MTRLSFTKSWTTLLKGAEALFIAAPKRAFEDGAFLDALPEEHMRLALELAAETAPGDLGAAAGTLTGAAPARLWAGILPDTLARYNAPSRSECLRRVASAAGVGGKGRWAVLLVLDDPGHHLAAANALGRALPLYSAKSAPAKAGGVTVLALGPDEEPLAPGRPLQATVEAAREAARLVDTPPSELHPRALQAEAWRLVRGLERVTKRAVVGERLLAAKLRGLHAVGRCALEAPRLLVLRYTPPRRARRHVALVGKGITFDTGGLSIKTGGNMAGMKADMGGAAAVLGAFVALARGGCPHAVSAVLCVAENAVGPAAYKLDDVIEFHSGLTVEINNTDAEGRLALADGVSYAARVLKADTILDAATLTGAQLVSTGKVHAALVSNDEELERHLLAVGRDTGDLLHPLPFAPELYKGEFQSAVADMRNSVADRMNAQSACAAQFIHWHLEGTDARWAHVDLAGPAFRDKRGTGFGVALLAEAVRRLA